MRHFESKFCIKMKIFSIFLSIFVTSIPCYQHFLFSIKYIFLTMSHFVFLKKNLKRGNLIYSKTGEFFERSCDHLTAVTLNDGKTKI
jgi:hypothetical protein